MGIDFAPDRWSQVRRVYGDWWAGRLERPVLPVVLRGRDPGRPCPDVPLLAQNNCHDLSIPAEAVIDRIDYELSCCEYLGDAFPFFNLDCFGPGVASAFLGAQLDNHTGQVWFHPPQARGIEDLRFEYDPENVWLKRIKDICRCGMARWRGRVLLGMPDLGGVLDILSTFRPGEQLLLDLYDAPEAVLALIDNLHLLWHCFYDEINAVLQPVNPGYSDWSGIYSETPSYILQCDFSYMISPDMFETFVLPELLRSCQRLPHTIFHLDGVGELNHLDALLGISALDAVQWIPGDGKPKTWAWPEVYRRIFAAGKGTQLIDGFRSVQAVREQTGTSRGILHKPITDTLDRREDYIRQLRQFGAPC